MRRVGAGVVLVLLLSGCGLPVTAPTGNGDAWLCTFVRDSVRSGSMGYDYAAYYYDRCQPIPAPEARP